MARINISVDDEVLYEIDKQMQSLKLKSRSEFIEIALDFYLSYLITQGHSDYLNQSVIAGVRQGVKDIERQTMPNIFGLSVELSVMNNILASLVELSPTELQRLRKDCVKAVKATKKRTNMENAVRYQQDTLLQPNSFYDDFTGQLDYSLSDSETDDDEEDYN